MEPSQAGRMLVALGAVAVLAGLVMMGVIKLPFGIGRLPGDIVIEKKNFTFYFPLATSVVLSVLISFILWLIGKR